METWRKQKFVCICGIGRKVSHSSSAPQLGKEQHSFRGFPREQQGSTSCFAGSLGKGLISEESLRGRLNLEKALIVVAAQEDGPGIGRIRMRQIVDASAAS